MYWAEKGTVLEVLQKGPAKEILLVQVGERREKAVNYPALTGPIGAGELLLLNTTASHLRLGSGGYHLVLCNLSHPEQEISGPGHIMKLRYTPLQLRVHAVEEERPDLFSLSSLGGLPVIVAPLHSHLAPLAMALKEWGPGDLSPVYIMTGGGALPLSWSDTVVHLKKTGLLHGTITCGQTFGGDLEAVNIYTALLAAKELFKAQVVLTSMGPGHVGTGSMLGFSGVEQAQVLDAVSLLQGDSFFVPRLNYAESRARHQGISHHTITLLHSLTRSSTTVVFPLLSGKKGAALQKSLKETGISKKHRIFFLPEKDLAPLVEKYGVTLTSMGYGIEEAPEFFLAPLLTGLFVATLLQGGE